MPWTEGHFLGLLFLLSGEFPLDAACAWVVAHWRLDGGHDFVGVVALEDDWRTRSPCGRGPFA